VSQLLQAKAYETAIEAHRRNMPHCMGSLYWQLNDSWPTISWSTVDYYGHWKASHYAVRAANERVMLSPVMEDDKVKVYAVSDRLAKIQGKLTLKVLSFNGEEHYDRAVDVTVESNTAGVIFSEDVDEVMGSAEAASSVLYVELEAGGEKRAENLFYFEKPKNLELPKANLGIGAKKTEDGYELIVKTDRIAKNVFLDTPDGAGHFSENFFDLLPGERKTVELKIDKEIDPKKISFKTLNQVQD
jgi:beta-mannosidase